MTILVNSFSVQITPIKDALGNNKILEAFSTQITPIKDALGNNKIIESSSISYKNGIFDRIIRYK
jgi:hypothetical protein